MTDQRRLTAQRVREDAAALAAGRAHPQHQANGDEQRYASANYALSFTKGLDHDATTGLLNDARDFEAYRAAIDNGFVEAFTRLVPVPRAERRRKWEAPTAGIVYELQGPDAQAVTMPPAPTLCSDELTFEMAEVYELALLRDVPFNAFDQGGGSADLTAAIGRLNSLPYAQDGFQGRPRKTDSNGNLDRQTAFRGSSPGVDQGPYLSQFMLIGNASDGITPDRGYINFGAQRIDQRVLEAESQDDYMMTWDDWHRVQQGYEVRLDAADPCEPAGPGQKFTGARRFIYTPRDLATYVHVDALYQAYLNACLILLGNGTPFDPGFDLLSGGADGLLYDPASGTKVPLNAGGFALWGGPHILSLVTEVATRGLKAVRYQKFNTHIRLRPEALAARIEKAGEIERHYPTLCGCFSKMADDLKEVVDLVRAHNSALAGEATALLPMAFAEGSPMHPAYGAGHATVAGACVTILKAFFDTSAMFVKINDVAGFYGKQHILDRLACGDQVEAGAYQVKDSGKRLDFDSCGYFELVEGRDKKEDTPKKYAQFKPKAESKQQCCPLTLEGELNKLAANISIGRNMAGVHYFTDYYDSLRMGEEIAIGILEEQALCYGTDPFVLTVPTFDGEVRRIGKR
jgi:hypothetical protein